MPKKPSLIVSLLSHKDDKEESEPDMGSEKDEGDEATQLSSSVLEAIKSDDASALYDALCALIDHHMDKDSEEGSSDSDSY
jgi:hypothetical protein